ncbi:cytochrome P450 [Eremomyces bilateralis CBS 781.70]|uniref:Cytochrome P450 n=1 Tax=Eremomyces bilateralis CBS 781.70 TaxID=1392243 RepID=A0A6G1GGC5_9PEZI|nr:cytochrome P450 [Eremomyces bilateralis CBS 781.70]KAF1817103.1 cytochrome P450 [Eremomyces bilateralis CBS 781.70]
MLLSLFAPPEGKISIPSLIVSVPVCSLVLWIVYCRTLHPLAKYPGPFLASFSRIWQLYRVFQGDMDVAHRDLHHRYGPVIRIAYDEVSISDASAIKDIYSAADVFAKTDFYTLLRPPFARYPDHFSSTDEKVHGQRRRIVNSLYSMTSVMESEGCIDQVSELFLRRMDDLAGEGKFFDLATWFQFYAFEVIGVLYFNKMFGNLENGWDVSGVTTALDTLLPIHFASCFVQRYLRPVFLLPGSLFSRVRGAIRGLSKLRDASLACVAERKNLVQDGRKTRADILDKMFRIYEERGKELDYNVIDVEVEIYAALFAGSDTTAISLTAIIYHLMKHPNAYDKLVEEIDKATDAGILSQPNIRHEEAMKLPYLDACCKEAMRLHPGIGWTVPRYVPKGGRTIVGQWFDEGIRVGINPAVTHFDRSVFGEDADQFNPDRWFRGDSVNMEKHMLVFGAGPRTCIAKNIALAEIRKLIPQLLRAYQLEMVDPGKEWKRANIWFNRVSGVEVRASKRSTS